MRATVIEKNLSLLTQSTVGNAGSLMLVPLLLMPILSILYTAYDKTENSIRVSFYLSLLNFVHSTILLFIFDPLNPSFQFLTTINGSLLGIDGISIWLIW